MRQSSVITGLVPLALSLGFATVAPDLPSITLRKASLVQFPGPTDCNSPGHWDGGTFYLWNSAPIPLRSSGRDLFHLGVPKESSYHNTVSGHRWIEATYKEENGPLYGWYHNEPRNVCASSSSLTAPRIGAVLSNDNGATWRDLGFVLEAPRDSLFCQTKNHYFAGGNGDFSVILDTRREYFYFFISTYHKDPSEQGVAVARMRFADRNDPVGKVWKWRQGNWEAPGVGGQVSPIFSVARDWNRLDADALWGPSIHWNTYLNTYVMLLNRAIDKDWKQEGIYITYNSDLSRPGDWTAPKKILDREEIVAVPKMGPGWYPQVIGLDKDERETDKLAGRVARLFVHGKSIWEVVFRKPGEEPE
ncbi:MAG: hypothetical protein GEU99_22065 [Luteitalea sp.]|nr:hypothetical protein [Luteitalea sp.]